MHISSSSIGRLTGLATIIGGLLWAVGGATALNAPALRIGMDGPHVALTFAGLLSLIGLARVGTTYATRQGPAGIVGVLLAAAGVVLIIVSKNLPPSVSSDVGWAVFYAGGVVLVLGSLAVGGLALAIGKARLLGGSFAAIGVFGVLQVVSLMAPGGGTGMLATAVLPVLIGLAWAAVGYALWSHESEAVERPVGTLAAAAGARR